MTKVLVVDDEPQMLEIVTFALETQGFETLTAANAEDGWKIFGASQLDLVVLDVMLPGRSGLTLCKKIRDQSDTPVLLLTAKGESADRVAGFEAGADDYVVKPFSPRELALRATAIVRRSQLAGTSHVVTNGPMTVDIHSGKVTLNGARLALSETESRLMVALADRLGQVVEWRDLLDEVWGTDHAIGGREMLKTTVYRLRARLGKDAGELIESVRGRGYTLLEAPATVTNL